MFRSLWFNKLLGVCRSRSARRRQSSQTRRPVRLHVESLEERVTPAATSVTVGGAVALSTAITAANNNSNQQYIITVTGPITLNSQLEIKNTAGVTIQAAANTTLSAADDSRLFLVDKGAKLIINDLTLQNGAPDGNGGAIFDAGGNVTLTNGTVVQNNKVIAQPFAQGGGVFVSAGGSLTVVNSTIKNNVVTGSNSTAFPGTAQGGGVFVSGASVVSITGSTITGNAAIGGNATGTAGGTGGTGSGGGVFISGAGWSLTLSSSIVSGNSALGGFGGKGGNGATGGPGADQTLVPPARGTGTPDGVQGFQGFVGGTGGKGGGGSDGGFGGFAQGGGVNLSGAGSVTITSTQFTSDVALGGSGGDGGTGGQGGQGGKGGLGGKGGAGAAGAALPFANGGNGGQGGQGGTGGAGGAGGSGGAGGDGGDAQAGGLFVGTGAKTLSISGSSFTSNTVGAGSGGTGGVGGVSGPGGLGGGGGAGGAGGAAGGFGGQNGVAGTSKGTGFTGATGPSGPGGVGGFGGFGGEASGGGAELNSLGTIFSSSFTGNTATGGTGGVGGAGGITAVKSPVTGAGGEGGDGGLAQGGGIDHDFGGALTILNSTIATNQAQGGTGGAGGVGGTNGSLKGAAGATGTGLGGGLSVAGFGNVVANDSFIANVATGSTASDGGGVFATDGLDSFDATSINNLLVNNASFLGAQTSFFFLPLFPTGSGPQFGFAPTSPTPVAAPITGANGVVFYPLEAGDGAIDTGFNSVSEFQLLAKAQGVPFNIANPTAGLLDEAGNTRVINKIIDFGAVEFSPSQNVTSVTVTPVNVGTSPDFQPVTINAVVQTSSGNPITLPGVVTFTLTDSNGKLVGSSVTVSVGATPPGAPVGAFAVVGTFFIPANEPAGTYTLTASYSGNGEFAASTGTATVTITPAPVVTTPPTPVTVTVPPIAVTVPPITVTTSSNTGGQTSVSTSPPTLMEALDALFIDGISLVFAAATGNGADYLNIQADIARNTPFAINPANGQNLAQQFELAGIEAVLKLLGH